MIPRMSRDEEQRDYLFIRHNPKGLHFERWRCDRGCGKWFHAARDTVTHGVQGLLRHHRTAARRTDGPGQRSVGEYFANRLKAESKA